MGNLSLYIPLGVIGFLRWLSWLVRRTPAALYQPVRNEHFEGISIIVPVYQEDPATFRRALESWLDNKVEEVICVIDVTDERSMAIASEYSVTIVPTNVPGKRDALRRGW